MVPKAKIGEKEKREGGRESRRERLRRNRNRRKRKKQKKSYEGIEREERGRSTCISRKVKKKAKKTQMK